MVIFHSYVSLPEGTPTGEYPKSIPYISLLLWSSQNFGDKPINHHVPMTVFHIPRDIPTSICHISMLIPTHKSKKKNLAAWWSWFLSPWDRTTIFIRQPSKESLQIHTFQTKKTDGRPPAKTPACQVGRLLRIRQPEVCHVWTITRIIK